MIPAQTFHNRPRSGLWNDRLKRVEYWIAQTSAASGAKIADGVSPHRRRVDPGRALLGHAFQRFGHKRHSSECVPPVWRRPRFRCPPGQAGARRKLRILTIVDTFSRYAPAVDARFSYRAEHVVATLQRVCAELGTPRTIRVDQGTEFVSRDLDLWAYANGVVLDFSRPGKPTDNAFIEAFNGRLRAECLNTHWFLTLADAREKLETWRRYYNEERPHGAIGYKPPVALMHGDGVTGQPSP